MHSCGSLARRFAGIVAFVLCCCASAHGQGSIDRLYKEALSRETALRVEISTRKAGAPALPLVRRARILVGTYEDLVQLFPRSPLGANALWQGGILSADIFREFGEASDRVAALRLLNALTSRYPASPLTKQAAPQLVRLGADVPPPSPQSSAPAVSPPTTPASRGPVTLTSITRETLPGTVRVTIELEREVAFYEERIEGPPRVFVDLQNTRTTEMLKDAILTYQDDAVRQIRVGRQLGGKTRVVLDLEGAGRHSAYALYNPYRIVIDIERPATSAINGAAAARTPKAGVLPAVAPAVAPVPARGVPAAASVTSPVVSSAPPRRVAIEATPVTPKPNLAGGLSISRQLGLGVARIVIDPGHGGHDPGAQGRGINEAELTLDVALRLEKLLLKEPGVEVVLTRRTNEYVPLEERPAIANREQADLFLSIHANASDDARARGVETYFLNFAQTPQAEATAARENAASTRTMRSLPDLVKAITLNNKADESRDFAARVQAAMVERLRTARRSPRNLGVKQAPFTVLIGAAMPSVLAEISFLTNRQEATWLKSQTYRQQLAEALFNGVMRYQRSLKDTQVAGGTATGR